MEEFSRRGNSEHISAAPVVRCPSLRETYRPYLKKYSNACAGRPGAAALTLARCPAVISIHIPGRVMLTSD
jgi:hypothetical protein